MNLYDHELFDCRSTLAGVTAPGGQCPVDPRCYNSKSRSRSTASQISGGTTSGNAAQAVGTNNQVNTGTQTTVTIEERNTTTTNSNNTIGNNSVVTYNTGLSADDIKDLLGNSIVGGATGGGVGTGGGGGVTVTNTPPVSTMQTQAIASVSKWAIWAAVAAGVFLVWRWLNKKK